MAASLDGRIGGHSLEGDQERQQIGLSSKEDQEYLREQIELCDAIVVGAGSIRSNGACLSHPGSGGKYPKWYILAQRAIPDAYEFWRQNEIPRVIISKEPIPIPSNAVGSIENLTYGDLHPAEFVYNILEKEGFNIVLLFGGGVINQMFYDKAMVDELRLTLAPVFIGKSQAPYLIAPELRETINLSLLECEAKMDSGFLFLRYSVN